MYVTPGARPHVLVPGRAATLSHTVLVAATEVAPDDVSAVTLQLQQHGENVGSAITAALDGSGPAYVADVPGSLTTGEAAGDGWAALWSYTIDGVVYVFRRLVRLVRVEVTPTVTSSELSAEYPDLVASLRASLADLRADLAEAWEDLDRDLWEHGVDVHRVFDPRALARLHMIRAAGLRYSKAGSSGRDEMIMDRAAALNDEYAELLKRPALYDLDSNGAADTKQRSTSMMPWDYIMRRHG